MDNPTTGIIDLESIIKRYVSTLEKLKADLKAQKQMFDDAFENDKPYKENAEKAQAATKAAVTIKQQILKHPATIELANKVKGIREEIKEMERALSDYLLRYQQVSGASVIEGDDGEIREIVHIAKLVKRSAKKV
jgi:Skp family chaperone for outer membrane proteins